MIRGVAIYKFGLLLLLCWSCTNHQNKTLFTLLPSQQTGLHFVNEVIDQDSMNIIQYLYFYNGGGVAVGDINKDGLQDLFFTANQQENKLFLNKGNLSFEDITLKAGIIPQGNWSTGANIVDVNGDGWLDIYVCQVGGYKSFNGRNQLFINQGEKASAEHPTFIEQATVYGLDFQGFSTQSAFFDYDMDGDLDLYLLNHSVHSTETYRDTSATRQPDPNAGDKLYRNDGTQFIEVTQEAGIISGIAGYGLGVAVADIDQNGCPDLYISNDFHEDDFLYLNACDGRFEQVNATAFGHISNFSMGNDIADLNNDFWPDIMTLDMKPASEFELKNAMGSDPYDIYRFKRSFGYQDQIPRNMLQMHRGLGPDNLPRFSEIGQQFGVAATDWSWSVLLTDLDNDGWKDIHISNGIVRRPNNLDYLKFISSRQIQENASDLELAAQMPEGKVSNYVFKNRGGIGFEDLTDQWGLLRPSFSNGSAIADLDNDGDLDIVVNNINAEAYLYQNHADQQEKNYLQLELQGPDRNPSAIGAKVQVFTGENRQQQSLFPTRGFQSSVGYTLHFGIDQAQEIDSIIIVWPDGKREKKIGIAVNQKVMIPYSKATADVIKEKQYELPVPLFRLLNDKELRGQFNHQENNFYDNSRETLIPYLLSTQGPKLAVADVNGDGKDDFFVGGASGQLGKLFVQDENGTWAPRPIDDLEAHRESEDTDLLFFDADGDGDQDIYIASAGNEYYRQDQRLRDRLYLNDGQGNFSFAPARLPEFYGQTSSVDAGDFDNDGDLDILVGGRSIPVSYGMAPDSYLLENQGDGTFHINENTIPMLAKLGMVTQLRWIDLDQDNRLDIVAVGDWMPITLIKQNDKGFEQSILPYTEGWWSALEIIDLEGDGDLDILLGNFGKNSNLQPSPEQPIRLYVGDIDGNLSKDPILTYYQEDKEYTFEGLDALSKQLVLLKKRFRQYETFAQSSLQEVIKPEELQRTKKLEAKTFSSMVLLNDGEGNLKAQVLPEMAQMSTVFAFCPIPQQQDAQALILGGNFFELQPAIGRMDASYGTLLKYKDGNFKINANHQSGLWLEGQIRDLKLLESAGKYYLLIARNNQALQIMEIQYGENELQ